MGTLYALLREIGTEAENNARRELSGSQRSMKALLYNMLMPMVLNFQTEDESYHFIFQKGGSVALQRGLHDRPDVKVTGEHAELIRLLQNKDKTGFEVAERTRKIKIFAPTYKGRLAVMKLRELFL
jgi:hypothetical protein